MDDGFKRRAAFESRYDVQLFTDILVALSTVKCIHNHTSTVRAESDKNALLEHEKVLTQTFHPRFTYPVSLVPYKPFNNSTTEFWIGTFGTSPCLHRY
jgi:hypothetical protein